MTTWKDEKTWLAARQGVLAEIRTWEQAPWIRAGGHTYSGSEKDEYIGKKLRGRL